MGSRSLIYNISGIFSSWGRPQTAAPLVRVKQARGTRFWNRNASKLTANDSETVFNYAQLSWWDDLYNKVFLTSGQIFLCVTDWWSKQGACGLGLAAVLKTKNNPHQPSFASLSAKNVFPVFVLPGPVLRRSGDVLMVKMLYIKELLPIFVHN